MSEFEPVWFDAVGGHLLTLLEAAGVPEFAMPSCGSSILAEMRRWVDNRNVKDFSHHYLVAVRRLEPEWGSGYHACIPQLGSASFNGCGETIEEALNNLQEVYTWLGETFEADERMDWKWPEPKTEDSILWSDAPPLSADEVHDRFKALLTEAHKKERDVDE